MSRQNFCLKKSSFNRVFFVLSSSFILLFAFSIILPTVSESTHAEGDEPDDGISILVSDSISANVTLFNEGDYKIAKDTVAVSSSAPYGYELFLSTDSEAHQSIYLNDDPTSESRIAPVSGTIAEPAVLTSNTWGFAIAGQGNFDNEYDPSNKLCNFYLSVFTEGEDGRYTRSDEVQTERCYTRKELTECLIACGFEVINFFGNWDFEEPKSDCERWYVVAKAIKQ